MIFSPVKLAWRSLPLDGDLAGTSTMVPWRRTHRCSCNSSPKRKILDARSFRLRERPRCSVLMALIAQTLG
jgi:hypothetical protein